MIAGYDRNPDHNPAQDIMDNLARAFGAEPPYDLPPVLARLLARLAETDRRQGGRRPAR